MIERFAPRLLLLLLSGSLLLPSRAAQSANRAPDNQPPPAASTESSASAFHPVSPSLIDGRIAFLTAAMLEQEHYLKRPFDASASSKFFDLYFDTFDAQHRTFLQSNLAEFEHYRTNLNRLTLTERRVGDTTPACEIFNRFMERLEQRTAYVDDLLKHEKFTFDTDERFMLNRKGLPYPKDLDEAKKMWREQLRFEYLQERLGKIGAKKKNAALAAKKKTLAIQTNALAKASESPAGNDSPPANACASLRRAETVPRALVSERRRADAPPLDCPLAAARTSARRRQSRAGSQNQGCCRSHGPPRCN